ncbi:hypothetical protein KI440_02205 [Candidatus Saccharibacteria bacterium TM7i]|nr:hypothetical protein KI440_02205 [Candidatus Saccharibacteria bacterium TM7i]
MVEFSQIIAGIAVCLVLAAYIPYMFDIVKGRVAPHPFSWLIWSMTATSIFFLQTTNGSGAGAYGTATVAVCASIIFVLAFRANKVKIRPLDITSLLLAVVGIILWIFVKQPSLSIAILLTVEVIGFIPTLLNGWREPYKDSITLWSVNGMRQGLGLAAVQNHNFVTVLNPIVWITLCAGYVLTLSYRRLFVKKHPARRRAFRPYN